MGKVQHHFRPRLRNVGKGNRFGVELRLPYRSSPHRLRHGYRLPARRQQPALDGDLCEAKRALFAHADFLGKITINRMEVHPSSERHRSSSNEEIEIGSGHDPFF